MDSAQVITLDAVHQNGCCGCALRPGLKRLHKVQMPHGHEFHDISKFCVGCGFIPGIGVGLDEADLQSSSDLYDCVANARKAVAAKAATTFDSCGMPHAFGFSDLGLIRPLSSSALFDAYPLDRTTLEPLLLEQLGLDPTTTPKRVLSAPKFTDIHVNVGATVGHIFEPDPYTKRPDRIDDNHLLYWPLIPLTLAQPFEIWQQQAPGKGNHNEWVFLACYVLEGEIRYHMVLVNRHRLVRTAYRLNGWKQAHSKRVGIPIYIGY